MNNNSVGCNDSISRYVALKIMTLFSISFCVGTSLFYDGGSKYLLTQSQYYFLKCKPKLGR